MLHFQHALDPLPRPGMGARVLLVATGLVQPVGSDAVVGHFFHFTGTDLDLDRYAMHAKQRGMQRLIAVGFGNGDVVLEPARQGFVQIMYSAQYAVAGVDLVDDDPECVNIHDLVKGPALAAHLLVDAVDVLLTTADFTLNAVDGQTVAERFFNLVDDFLAIAPGTLDRLINARRAHRVHRLETEVFEFDTNAVHTQPIGDGCVDFQGFLGNPSAFFAGQHFEGTHVVQTVSQLHQDHADVACHGHGHLLEVFCLGFGLGFEVHLRQLADAIDQVGHGFAELRYQRFLGNTGVFNHVMQHGRHQALMVHMHVGKDIGHCQRVRDIRLATASALAVVGLFCVEVRPADQIDLVRAEVRRQAIGEGVYARHEETSCQNFLPFAVLRRPGIGLVRLVGLVLERCEQRFVFDDFSVGDKLVAHQAFCDFAQGNNGRLVVFPLHQRLFTAGGQLTGTLGREHDQLKAVIHVF